MMYVRFKNETVIPTLGVHSQKILYNGINRDHLIFLFNPGEVSISDIEREFTPENCKTIIIGMRNSENTEPEEFAHIGYTILLGFGYANRFKVLGDTILSLEDAPDISNPETIMVNYVKMVQTTTLERNVESQGEALKEVIGYLSEIEAGTPARSTRYDLQAIMSLLE